MPISIYIYILVLRKQYETYGEWGKGSEFIITALKKNNASIPVNVLFTILVLSVKEKLNCTLSITHKPMLFR